MLSLRTLSIRTKLLTLVMGVALLMGGASGIYSFVRTNLLLREEVVKRGRYFAQNLALNSYFGILTEDKPILAAQMENALSAATEKKGGASKGTEKTTADKGETDILGVMIRGADGQILVQSGQALRTQDLPREAAKTIEQLDAVAVSGEEVLLFRAPVLAPAAAGGDLAAEMGVGAATPAGSRRCQGRGRDPHQQAPTVDPTADHPAGDGPGGPRLDRQRQRLRLVPDRPLVAPRPTHDRPGGRSGQG